MSTTGGEQTKTDQTVAGHDVSAVLRRRPQYVQHHEASYVDEVRIITRERWKESELSGAEWRFSYVLQAFRKGKLLGERSFGGSISQALAFSPLGLAEMLEQGKGMIGGTDDAPEHEQCFQPGCPDLWVVEYRIRERFGPQGQRLHPESQMEWPELRRFCERHRQRGDCGREDADDNYIVVADLQRDG